MSTNPQPITMQELDEKRRAELGSELVSRLLDHALLMLNNLDQLKRLVTAFSTRHGHAVDIAVNGLLDALEALVPDLEEVKTHPETWNRHK